MRSLWKLYGLVYLVRALVKGPVALVRYLARRQVRRAARRV